jgi:hypothetical protein
MKKNSTRLNQVSRSAAIALILYAGLIVGVCFLVLRFTAWNQSQSVEKEPYYTEIPGVSMKHLPPATADAVVKKLNVLRCHCECMRSVASCRNHHASCAESIVAAQDQANAAGRH